MVRVFSIMGSVFQSIVCRHRLSLLDRAETTCEACGHPATYSGADGFPFLDTHHLRKLTDSESDTVTNAFSVCPNCPAISGFISRTTLTRTEKRSMEKWLSWCGSGYLRIRAGGRCIAPTPIR
ncbi:hypothetical protein Bcep18194_A4026 [Burkholderia lata]|uniref:HNH endonuclease n=1 Tax=Burkholderia lata (strain ATCC 17760 / DSM 23089 / LMG 22485 / NCIMB 9086 / R18194 / 383) TaxID=482957 RepID=Q39IU3_BURL3|nr:hypothetical protein Bcep18194_A4026 [Burkholderia lata]